MMVEALSSHAELIAVIVTVISGFGVLSFQIGRKFNKVENLDQRFNVHEEDDRKRNEDIAQRLADGSEKMGLIPVLDERTQNMQSDLRQIKSALITGERHVEAT